MRRALLLPVLTLCLSAQDPTLLKAPITRVRLHPDEAWVTRAGRVRVEAGVQKVELGGLPSGLSLEDLQVSAKGPAGLRLGDVAVAAEVRTVMETPEWKKLEGERETLRDRQDELESQRESLKEEQAFLKSLQASHAKELSTRLAYTLPQAQSLAEFSRGVQTRLASLMQQERKASRNLDELKKELARVQAEMQKRQGEQRTAPSVVRVELTSPAAGSVELELSYRQTQARWRPVYEARLAEDRKALALGLSAAITQRTGESWKGVTLEVSNARPSRGLAVASFSGYGLVQPLVRRDLQRLSKSSMMENSYALAPGEVRGGTTAETQLVIDGIATTEASPAESPDAAISTEATGLATTWTLDGGKDIPSDGEPHRFKVTSRNLAPRLAFLAAPRMSTDVQQIARFDPPSAFPLFPGAPVTHYAGSQRLGESQLQVPPAGQPFTLGFGPYKPLRLSFRRADRKEELVGAFSKDHQWTLRDVAELANDTPEEVTVELQDRILKSEREDIKVTQLPDTTPGAVEKIPGVRTWTLAVPPKGRASLTLSTQVRAPQGMALQGIE